MRLRRQERSKEWVRLGNGLGGRSGERESLSSRKEGGTGVSTDS